MTPFECPWLTPPVVWKRPNGNKTVLHLSKREEKGFAGTGTPTTAVTVSGPGSWEPVQIMVSILLRGITGYALVSTGPQLCVVVTQAHEALGETLPCGGGGE